jgi:hypothetical protein
MVTLCGVPGVSVNVDGLTVTPAGSPLIVTVIVPVKSFTGTKLTLTCRPVPPAANVTVAGFVVSEKPAVNEVSAPVTLMHEERGMQASRRAAKARRPRYGH